MCEEDVVVGVFWGLEILGFGRSAEEALRGVGLGVKVFRGLGEDDGLGVVFVVVAAWLVLEDARIVPHRAVPLKPVKVVP